MKKAVLSAGALLLLLTISVFSQSTEVNSGDYLGQEPPGMEPKVFAPGIVSTSMSEWCICISPNLDEIYYGITGAYATIVVIKKDKSDNWAEPEVASFSGRYSDYEPSMSPDGKRIFFVSNRPLNQTGEPKKDTDIWYVERTDSGWSEAHHTGSNINSDESEYYPSIASNGTLYFTAQLEGDSVGYGIYTAEPNDNSYDVPVRMSDSVNTRETTGHSYIAPDESYIVYSSNGREDSKGRFDLYVSFKNDNGTWTKSRNLGDMVNSLWSDDYPYVSPDGRYLFFTSARRTQPKWNENPLTFKQLKANLELPGNGSRDIYWIDASVLDSLRTAETPG